MKLTIFDIENWKEIGTTLMRNKTRTILTGFGIFWGVAMLAMLTGGARGGEDMLRRNFAGFASNTAGIMAETTTLPYHGHRKGRKWQLDMTDVELLRESFPGVKVVPSFVQWGKSVKHGRFSYSGSLTGATSGYTDIMKPQIYEGRFVNDADVESERKVAVIGKKIATQLFPDGETPIGKTIDVAGSAYSVIGVAGDVSEIHLMVSLDESVVIPASTFRRVNGYGDNVDLIMLTAPDGINMSDILPRARSILLRRHDISPDDKGAINSINIAEMFAQIEKVFTGIDILAWFIGLSTLIAGVIGIGNIMWVIVKERTQEIGIRRAVGARPKDIIIQVLSEGMILTLVAGLAGITFATIVLGIMQQAMNPPDAVLTARFQMSFMTATGILLIFLTLGTSAGLIPAIKAMKIKPIEALNDK